MKDSFTVHVNYFSYGKYNIFFTKKFLEQKQKHKKNTHCHIKDFFCKCLVYLMRYTKFVCQPQCQNYCEPDSATRNLKNAELYIQYKNCIVVNSCYIWLLIFHLSTALLSCNPQTTVLKLLKRYKNNYGFEKKNHPDHNDSER